jgi:hypothetical protein
MNRFFNFMGIAILVVGFGIAIAAARTFELHSADRIQFAAGMLIVAMDISLRLRKRGVDTWSVAIHNRQLGGQLFGIPIWIGGVSFILQAAYRLTSG